jgi:hypothetical protein
MKKQRPDVVDLTYRPEHIHLTLSKTEKEWLLKAAKANGLTASGMLRKWIRQEAEGRY